MSQRYTIGPFAVGGDAPLLLIAGPCVIESAQMCIDAAGRLKEVAAAAGVTFIFKASYDKANRTSVTSFRGPGLEAGLATLAAVREQVGVPVTSDIHEPAQAAAAGEVLDMLQVPAFLCRQTDLLVAAGQTGKPVNVKKGQFVAPWDMKPAVEKVRSTGNSAVLLTDRGVCFGYNRLVTDFRAIPQMQSLGCPVIFDATHSAQEPGAGGTVTGGDRSAGPLLAKCAMAAGADGLFIETHPDPERAKSDAAVQLPLDQIAALLDTCLAIRAAARG
ncbi:MAG: 2-dehydro-3-deoxyphosphooctonate aldolase [Phycisphaerae bacterium]|nr:2-dehydro-3-deoxyphosphooctonate aldolase [Phycisphaerae bacterium]